MYFGNPHSVWVQIDFLCTTLHKDLPPFSSSSFALSPNPFIWRQQDREGQQN